MLILANGKCALEFGFSAVLLETLRERKLVSEANNGATRANYETQSTITNNYNLAACRRGRNPFGRELGAERGNPSRDLSQIRDESTMTVVGIFCVEGLRTRLTTAFLRHKAVALEVLANDDFPASVEDHLHLSGVGGTSDVPINLQKRM